MDDSWADDVEELPPRTETKDPATGIITVVEYSRRESDGKTIKTTKKIRRSTKKTIVSKSVAQRMEWPKFGLERGKPRGPDYATTSLGEEVTFTLQLDGRVDLEEEQRQALKAKLKDTSFQCRHCGGKHFTYACPYKDAFTSIAAATAENTEAPKSNKYVPPSQRAGAKPSDSRDEYPTLRVTNLSEDTTDDDMRALFGKFGPLHRIYVGKDQATGLCRGFAYVSYLSRADGQRAIEKVDGLPYGYLILSCGWSVPKKD